MNSKHYEGKLKTLNTNLLKENGISLSDIWGAEATRGEDIANAAELAHRWNCHQELVEALEWMLADGTPDRKCGGHGGSSCSCICATEKAKAALQKAKGEK